MMIAGDLVGRSVGPRRQPVDARWAMAYAAGLGETAAEYFDTTRPDGVVVQAQWKTFKRRYLAEMKDSDKSRLLDTLAALSHHGSFAVGCYCENEERCHRSVLRELLAQRGAKITG